MLTPSIYIQGAFTSGVHLFWCTCISLAHIRQLSS